MASFVNTHEAKSRTCKNSIDGNVRITRWDATPNMIRNHNRTCKAEDKNIGKIIIKNGGYKNKISHKKSFLNQNKVRVSKPTRHNRWDVTPQIKCDTNPSLVDAQNYDKYLLDIVLLKIIETIYDPELKEYKDYEIISKIVNSTGITAMISAMRPDIDNIEAYIRNTIAHAFVVVAIVFGIPTLLSFLKVVCQSTKWQDRYTGIKIVQQIAVQINAISTCIIKQLIEVIINGLIDEHRNVRSITVLSMLALAETATRHDDTIN